MHAVSPFVAVYDQVGGWQSHAGKVVERHWYDKNKHIVPASRWEIYDPTKKWERYTIHGTA